MPPNTYRLGLMPPPPLKEATKIITDQNPIFRKLYRCIQDCQTWGGAVRPCPPPPIKNFPTPSQIFWVTHPPSIDTCVTFFLDVVQYSELSKFSLLKCDKQKCCECHGNPHPPSSISTPLHQYYSIMRVFLNFAALYAYFKFNYWGCVHAFNAVILNANKPIVFNKPFWVHLLARKFKQSTYSGFPTTFELNWIFLFFFLSCFLKIQGFKLYLLKNLQNWYMLTTLQVWMSEPFYLIPFNPVLTR